MLGACIWAACTHRFIYSRVDAFPKPVCAEDLFQFPLEENKQSAILEIMENCATTLKMNSEQASEWAREREMVMELLSLIHAWHGGSLCLSDSINPALPILKRCLLWHRVWSNARRERRRLFKQPNNAHRDNQNRSQFTRLRNQPRALFLYSAAGDFNAPTHEVESQQAID